MHFFIYTVGSGEVIRQACKMPNPLPTKKEPKALLMLRGSEAEHSHEDLFLFFLFSFF
jgi:hypothetical protein